MAACSSDPPPSSDGGGDSSGSETAGGDGETGSGDGSSSTTNGTGPDNECDLCLQDCNEGDRCVPVSDQPDLIPDRLTCEPEANSPVLNGERCQIEEYYGSGKDNCEIGTFCVLDDLNSLEGTCQSFCCTESPESGCEPHEICEPFFTGYDQVPPVPLCMPECDPLQPTSCADADRPGWTCIPTDIGPACRFVCVPETPRNDGDDLSDQGQPCLLWSDCKPGLHCQPAEATACAEGEDGWCCTAFCDPGEPDNCPSPLECVPMGCEDPNSSHVGACVLP
jgi:hypothetical protein